MDDKKIPEVLQYDLIGGIDSEEEEESIINEEIVETNEVKTEDIFHTKEKDASLEEKVVEENEPPLEEDNELLEEVKSEIADIVDPPKKKKLTKRGKERKPMTEEHKAKLAANIKKAQAARRLKTEGRKTLKQKEKEQKDLELQLKHKKREMKTKLLKEELDSTEDIIQKELPKSDRTITYKDLEEIQARTMKAIEDQRLLRKAQKKKEKQEKDYQNNIMKQINPPMYHEDPSNIYANCF